MAQKSTRTGKRTRGPDEAHYTTVPAKAKELGIDQMKIHGWIRRGELLAINIAENPAGRPRWRIPIEAWESFMAIRSNAAKLPAPRPPRPRVREKPAFEYY